MCTARRTADDFTRENLKNYDIVAFYTTTDKSKSDVLPIPATVLDYFLNDWLKQKGHGFVGFHSATDTYHNTEAYWDMIGGTFNGHPWGSHTTVTITVDDPNFPASHPSARNSRSGTRFTSTRTGSRRRCTC